MPLVLENSKISSDVIQVGYLHFTVNLVSGNGTIFYA